MKPKKRIIILGATGSVGATVLEEIARSRDQFEVVGISCHSAIDRAEKIAKLFSVPAVAVVDGKIRVPGGMCKNIFRGVDGLTQMVNALEFDAIVVAISGVNGLRPTLRAIDRAKTVILASKEVLVIAGEMVMDLAKAKGATLLPLDSEHNAIFQCLKGNNRFIRSLWLTASGGKFWNVDGAAMDNATAEMVLRHPKWSMGRKITVDSSTMANKGLEMIEAMHLFGAKAEQIRVAIHPSCIVHSLVEFCDGSFLAQMSPPSMRYPVRHCLFYPERTSLQEPSLDLFRLAELKFFPPDFRKFPCLGLAAEVARERQSKHIAYNAANEVAVELFLQEKIALKSIAEIIAAVLPKVENRTYATVEEVLAVDQMVRSKAAQWAKRFFI
ncbi:MAG: 1-deoxy-D-xylulose-5-phosphate reductoisomerase [Puniceicoccales bacterium]|jgi:1-deoxy-D-xylulose-5-phosphate reductoisomerase|nr:1-deoxy-D-xylulose-5-phosphate reductoisomerase [Puniceicoccales bacterium]